MNELEEIEPTLETIKKFADEKRRTIQKITPEIQQKRLENLAKGREARRLKLLEKKGISAEPEIKGNDKGQTKQTKKLKKMIVIEDSEEDEESKKEQPEEIVVKKTVKQSNHNNHNQETLKDLYDSINKIKDLINTQKDDIIQAVKPKPRNRAKPTKPTKVIKSLDLTVNDAEVDKIINENENKIQPKTGDAKLNAFLEALQKR